MTHRYPYEKVKPTLWEFIIGWIDYFIMKLKG